MSDVGNVRILVHGVSNSVAPEVGADAVAGGAADRTDRGVGGPAVESGTAVDAEHVTIGQPVPARDVMQGGVIDRCADSGRERRPCERREIAEERRGGTGCGQDLSGRPVKLSQPHAWRGLRTDRSQNSGNNLTGGVHRIDLARRLVLDHAASH
jgi:hypothetical protein